MALSAKSTADAPACDGAASPDSSRTSSPRRGSGWTAEAQRVLKALGRRPGRWHQADGRTFVEPAGGRTLTITAGSFARMQGDGLLQVDADGTLEATPAGLAWLRRRLCGGETAFRDQHGDVVRERLPDPSGNAAAAGAGFGSAKGAGRMALTEGASEVRVDLAESPLGWLARRPGPNGRAWIDAAQFAAAERLRADFTRGGVMPRITQDWSGIGGHGGRSGQRGGMTDLSDAAMAARERMGAALKAVGPELSGVLLDVCCFLKGLETVERERGWPPRSAKVILGLGLSRLAAHYGLSVSAIGPTQSRSRHWGAAGFRPTVSPS